MSGLPRIAFAIRQPWAWAVIHGGKDLENRTSFAMRHLKHHRGPTAILASKGMMRDEYDSAREFMAKLGVACPAPADLVRGAIIGSVDFWDWTRAAPNNRWWMPPQNAFRLRDPVPCDPIPCSGQLGFFEWKPGGEVQSPLPWMLKAAAPERVAAAVRPARCPISDGASEADLFDVGKAGEG